MEVFSLQKVAGMFEEVIVRDQANMEDKTTLRRPICSTFEVLVVCCVGRCCCGELGPFC